MARWKASMSMKAASAGSELSLMAACLSPLCLFAPSMSIPSNSETALSNVESPDLLHASSPRVLEPLLQRSSRSSFSVPFAALVN